MLFYSIIPHKDLGTRKGWAFLSREGLGLLSLEAIWKTEWQKLEALTPMGVFIGFLVGLSNLSLN